MKWLARSLWLLAWSLWLLLGFGLYRELPRQIGARVSQIPLESGQSAAFIKDTHHVAMQPHPKYTKQGLKLFDAETGAYVRDVPFEQRWAWLPPLETAKSHGVVVSQVGARWRDGLQVLDLKTDRTMVVSKMSTLDPSIHPTKPWIAFRESAAPIDKPRPLVVVDWTTGSEVFVRPRDPEYTSLGGPIFMGDDRLLVFITRHLEPNPDAATALEIWRLGPPNRREKVLHLPLLGRSRIQTSPSGRILWSGSGLSSGAIQIFDVDRGRIVFSKELLGSLDPPHPHQTLNTPRLSTSGRALMVDGVAALWSIDSGRLIWIQKGWRPPVLLDDDSFAELEEWDAPWTRGKLRNWSTAAVRDLDAAALRFRCWDRDASALECRSSDGALGLTRDGAIHRLPFRVNWLLLALCQTILALPLILLWTVLRWRRRRAAQRKLAVATP